VGLLVAYGCVKKRRPAFDCGGGRSDTKIFVEAERNGDVWRLGVGGEVEERGVGLDVEFELEPDGGVVGEFVAEDEEFVGVVVEGVHVFVAEGGFEMRIGEREEADGYVEEVGGFGGADDAVGVGEDGVGRSAGHVGFEEGTEAGVVDEVLRVGDEDYGL